MSFRTACCKKSSLIFALLAVAILAAPAFAANNCLKDVSRANSCTANDVSLAAVLSNTVNVYKGGIVGTNQCIEKGQFNFTATFEVKTTSSSTRSNIGIYFGTGQNNALSGTCTNDILSPQHACGYIPDPNNPNGPEIATATCGDAQYSEKDTSINGETGPNGTQAGCGDTASGDSSVQFGAGTHAATLDVVGVTCPAAGTTCPAGSGVSGSCLVLPVCTSWYQPANGMPVCESPVETAPTDSYPWVPAAIPGAPSKCTCGVLYVPVIPVTVTPKVAKACTTTLTNTAPTFDFSGTTGSGSPASCNAGPEGSTVTYTVAIKSTATLAGNNTVVDQICDSAYGNIFTAAGFSGPACPAGSSGITASNVNCPPSPIAPGGTGTCTFTAVVGENLTGLIDTVSASGHSSIDSSSTFTNTQSNSVTVTSSDAPSSETTTKSLDSLVHGCATLRLAVNVHNSSTFDEVLSLTALTDTVGGYGDITSVHGSVVGTTCGQPATNTNGGTLSGTAGAGALPVSIAVGGDYSCKFDAQICGDLTTVNKPGGGTCLGLTETDSVVPTLAGDEGAGEAVSHTDATLNEAVCFTHVP